MITRKTLMIGLCIALAALAWNTVKAQEVVTLHVLGPGVSNHYATLWVVDAKPYVWIRAETPDRKWLDPLRQSPDVYVWRQGQRVPFRATVLEDSETVAYVDQLFREKYGWMDQLRGLMRSQPTVAVQLEPR